MLQKALLLMDVVILVKLSYLVRIEVIEKRPDIFRRAKEYHVRVNIENLKNSIS